LPTTERVRFSDKPVSGDDEEIILELTTNLKRADFPEYPIRTVGWDKYMNSIEKFLELEGKLPYN
jgi:hypothetical protein